MSAFNETEDCILRSIESDSDGLDRLLSSGWIPDADKVRKLGLRLLEQSERFRLALEESHRQISELQNEED